MMRAVRTLNVTRGFLCDIEWTIVRMLRSMNSTKEVGPEPVLQNTVRYANFSKGEIANCGLTYVLEATPSATMVGTTWFVGIEVDVYELIQHHADFHKLEKKARHSLRSAIAVERAQLRESATVWSAPSPSEDDAP